MHVRYASWSDSAFVRVYFGFRLAKIKWFAAFIRHNIWIQFWMGFHLLSRTKMCNGCAECECDTCVYIRELGARLMRSQFRTKFNQFPFHSYFYCILVWHQTIRLKFKSKYDWSVAAHTLHAKVWTMSTTTISPVFPPWLYEIIEMVKASTIVPISSAPKHCKCVFQMEHFLGFSCYHLFCTHDLCYWNKHFSQATFRIVHFLTSIKLCLPFISVYLLHFSIRCCHLKPSRTHTLCLTVATKKKQCA